MNQRLRNQLDQLITQHARPVVRDLVRAELSALNAQQARAVDVPSLLQTIGAKEMPITKDSKGLTMARIIRSLAAAKGDVREAARFALKEYGESSIARKALAAGDATAGGFLVEGELANEVIDLLRPKSVIRQMNPIIVRPTKGTLEFPKITSGASANYLGENEDITVSEQVFGSVVLSAKKLAALVPVSNDLLRYGADADNIIRSDMVQAIATTEDVNFLRGQGLENKPRGLRYWADSGNVSATNGTSAAAIEKDFKDLLQALEGNNVPMSRPHWIMAPRSKNHLFTLRDANGNLIYPEIRNAGPVIHGYPVLVSNNVPTNLGSGSNETELYLVDADEIYLGEVHTVELDVSREGSYSSGGTMVSAFTRDQTLIRAILHHDLAVRHPVAVAVKTGITWGA